MWFVLLHIKKVSEDVIAIAYLCSRAKLKCAQPVLFCAVPNFPNLFDCSYP